MLEKSGYLHFYVKSQIDIIPHYYLVKYHSASEALEILKSPLFNQQAKRESVLGAFLRNPKDKILKSTNWEILSSKRNQEMSNQYLKGKLVI